MADDTVTRTHSRYLDNLMHESAHRKKWLKAPIRSKRYIRGIIRNQVSDAIHSRRSGEETTDPLVRAYVIAKTRGHCYLCHRQWNPRLADLLPRLYFKHIQIDHVIAFSHSGPNSLSNYMPICSSCNNRKSNLSLAEYHAGIRKGWRQ